VGFDRKKGYQIHVKLKPYNEVSISTVAYYWGGR